MVDVRIEDDEAFDDLAREATKEAANRWFSWSQERLYQKGDQHGFNVSGVAQSGQPPQWSDQDGGFRFRYNHHAAQFFEFGAKPHEIEAQDADVLAFEWENAPPEVQEMFSDTFPLVFLPDTDHPGMPELRFLRDSRERVRTWARNQGQE